MGKDEEKQNIFLVDGWDGFGEYPLVRPYLPRLPKQDYPQKTAQRKEANLVEGRIKRVRLGASCTGLNKFTASRAKDIEQIIALLILRGEIDPDNLSGEVLDFGMGTGPGAYILNQYGGKVTGVDSMKSGIETAIKEGIIPAERAIVKDGFEYLSGLQPESLNFIAVFMMQSSFSHKKLYQESQRVLKPNGHLLITGGLYELNEELRKKLGRYGRIEEIITFDGSIAIGNVAFIHTKPLIGGTFLD